MTTIRLFTVATVLVSVVLVNADPVWRANPPVVKPKDLEILPLDLAVAPFVKDLEIKPYLKPQPKASITTNYDCKCGTQSNSRIVGGTSAASGETPWQAGLIWRYSSIQVSYPFCGATIISPYHVITAAHCTTITSTTGNYAITYGTLNWAPDFNLIVDVETVTDHPSYSSDTYKNDISIMKLKTALTFSSTVGSACLPDSTKDYAGETSLLSGWGHTTDGGSNSDVLLKVELPVGTDTTCSASWGSNYDSTTMMCCDGSTTKDTCQGDSGGPLVVKNTGSYDLVGVVSFGSNCASGVPGVYARVANYLTWINETVSATTEDYFCSK